MTASIETKSDELDRSALSGFYEVHGYFFANDFLKEADIRQRILTLWVDGSALYQLETGYVLVQPNASFQQVSQTTGAALIKQGSTLSNRLRTNTTAATASKGAAKQLRLLYRGEWHQTALNNQNQYDPAQWFEAGDYQCVVLAAHAPVIPDKPKSISFGEKTSTSEIVDKEGLKPSTELQQVLEDLKQKTNAARGDKPSKYSDYGATKTGASVLNKLKAGLSRLLMRSPLADAIGKAQAKFIEDTLQKFQDGNLEEALKRAIPIGSMKDALDSIDHPFTGRFMPRSELSISLQQSQGGRSISLDEQVLEMLKHTYQKAFEKLDAEGRIEEAAFVLVDLLQEIDQAISYLEKHKKYLMAAQIAEGHQVEPARIIRQWILADDWKRAIQIARISNRYEEAITLLSASHKAEADQLRWMLADMHYASGNLETAVEIGWPVTEKRPAVLAWLKESVALGGSLGIRHQLKLALYDQDGEDEYIPAIQQLFRDDSSSSAAQRLQLIDELNQYPTNSVAKSLASMAVRPYLRDVAKGWIHHDNSRWNRLITLADDHVLRTDVSRINISESNSKQPLRTQTQPVKYALSACFGRHILDCQRLADGSLLLAFGEAGVEHRSAQGELLASYADICHEIVMSDQGYQALLVAVHEGFQVVAVFDLVTRSTTYWQQTKLDTWADNYDGLSWIVAKADRLWVLDLQQASMVSLWSLGDLKGDVTLIRRDPACFSFLVQSDTNNELWKYRLPDLFLKERTPWGQATLTDIPADMSSSGKLLLVSTDMTSFAFYPSNENEYHPINEGSCQQLRIFADWLVVGSESEASNHLSVYAYTEVNVPTLLLDIPYPKGEELTCRCDGEFLLLHSDAGRVMVVELEYGALVVELTV